MRSHGANTTTNTVSYNDIGLNSAGTVPIPNAEHGLSLSTGTHGNIIGGSGKPNYIGFNGGSGVYFASGAFANSFLTNRVFSNNLWGVVLDGSGTGLNVISDTVAFGNGMDGIAERNDASLNIWRHISTYQNGGLGIDKLASSLSGNIVDGPFPEDITVNSATGVITGTASANALVEVYQAALDPSGYGEGMTYVGSALSDGSGDWSLALAPGAAACYTAFETTGLFFSSSSEFGPSNCDKRLFVPLLRR